jgi:hypothetical protein
VERNLSVIAGSLLLGWGLNARFLARLIPVAVGVGLLYRGFSGYCPVYEALGLSSADEEDEELVGRRRAEWLKGEPTLARPTEMSRAATGELAERERIS